jgi:hypothetical protein
VTAMRGAARQWSRDSPAGWPLGRWPERDDSCRCQSTPKHSAHGLKTVRIQYRWHPLFGQNLRLQRMATFPRGECSILRVARWYHSWTARVDDRPIWPANADCPSGPPALKGPPTVPHHFRRLPNSRAEAETDDAPPPIASRDVILPSLYDSA